MSERIVVHNAGGHTRTVVSILLQRYKAKSIVIIDKPIDDDEYILGVRVKNNYDNELGDKHLISIGDNEKRKIELNNLIDKDYKIINCISKKAFIYNKNELIENNFNNCVSHNVYIGPSTIVGSNNIFNTSSVIEHEVIIGDNNHIAPSAVICGRVQIGNNNFIGANATVKENIEISNNVIIGAGSVVIDDILKPGVYAGVPVRKVKVK